MAPSADATTVQVDQFSPPPGATLIPSSQLDTRSDAEIETWLQTKHPITSDKNVWAFWHAGWYDMKPWCRRNMINWVRRHGSSWNVHFVDNVEGSETNILNYVESSWFPEAFNNKTMDGHHLGTHQGDLIRLPLLYLYGGVWLDVGTILFRHLDDICWKEIEDPNSPYEIGGLLLPLRAEADSFLNGFIVVKRGNEFIRQWHEIYTTVWGSRTNQTGFTTHPLLKDVPLPKPTGEQLSFEDTKESEEWDWRSLADYAGHFACFERLRKTIDPNTGFNGPEYYANNFWLAPAMQETYFFQNLTMWDGTKQFELLSAKREGVDKDETWQAADSFVNTSLANTAMMKVSHGPGGTPLPWLANFWDEDKNADKDHEEGTFAAYLRYGSVHFDQVRKIVPVKLEVTKEPVFNKGYLEE